MIAIQDYDVLRARYSILMLSFKLFQVLMAEEWEVFQPWERSTIDDAKALRNAGDQLPQWRQTRGL